jgi:hypothetical protein
LFVGAAPGLAGALPIGAVVFAPRCSVAVLALAPFEASTFGACLAAGLAGAGLLATAFFTTLGFFRAASAAPPEREAVFTADFDLCAGVLTDFFATSSPCPQGY